MIDNRRCVKGNKVLISYNTQHHTQAAVAGGNVCCHKDNLYTMPSASTQSRITMFSFSMLLSQTDLCKCLFLSQACSDAESRYCVVNWTANDDLRK